MKNWFKHHQLIQKFNSIHFKSCSNNHDVKEAMFNLFKITDKYKNNIFISV